MVNVARFDDDIARLTDWHGASSRELASVDARLAPSSAHSLSYRVSVALALCYGFIILLGLMFIYGWARYGERGRTVAQSVLAEDFQFFLVGIVCGGIGAIGLYRHCKPQVFDRRSGWYWRGWRSPGRVRRPRIGKEAVRLEMIHALQLLTKEVQQEHHTIELFELNLVLKNAERISLRCHGDQALLRKEAAMLGKFLCVPVWDASG